MQTEFVHIGYCGTIAINRVLAIASPDCAPIKRMIRQANKEGRIINLTYRRKAKTVIVLDSGHIALAEFQPNISLRRINEYRARGGGLLDLTLDGAQPLSGAEQQDSSLLHRRADDYALWPPQGERPPHSAATPKGERPYAGEEKLDE